MSCGTQESPHLLLDTVAICETLGVSFIAAAGAAGCCGKPYIAGGLAGAGEQWVRSKLDYAREAGATTQVNWCTACQVTSITSAGRREILSGAEHPVREVQLLTFLIERIGELGDRVPWRNEVRRRVIAEGHQAYSPVHAEAYFANARLLELIPGVEVVGLYDGFAEESPCGGRGREPGMAPWTAAQTPEEIMARRERVADVVTARGADTIACQHQGCHQLWGPYASDRLAVRHAVSILAEALGCAHPDRHQAAVRLGDADAIVEQTRPIWSSWGLDEAKARELAGKLADPAFGVGVTSCSCGGEGGGCREELIDIDVLSGQSRPAQRH
jgi:Fe-S oxidoreductase